MNPANANSIGIRIQIKKRSLRACFPDHFLAAWMLANWITAALKNAGEPDAFCALTAPLADAIGTVHGLKDSIRSLAVVRGVLNSCGLNLAQLCYFDLAEEIWRAEGTGDQVAFHQEFDPETLRCHHDVMVAQAEKFLAQLKLADQMPS